ncbi:MAG TPA: tripartite tricarboxylate transporter substrate binding protein [Burkholderiales bacterium]|nr:tripartite tricarboxylate transporter substrate binding protein [Burkholderiales bacterium]
MNGVIRNAAWLFALACSSVTAQEKQDRAADYPAKAVQLVICYAPGGGLDVIGRIVAERLTRNLGRQVVVENRPGAGGNIGTAYVSKAAADGHTLLETTNSHNINPLIYRNPGYDPRKDFVAVVQLTEAPSVIVTSPKLPYRTLKDLLSAARAAPGKLSYGSAGNGSPTNIAMEMFKAAANVDITHVPYKSAAQSHMDVVGGSIPLAMAAVPSAAPSVASGILRALAVTSEKRWPTLSDVPTVAESGYPGFSHMTWIGVFVPAGTPPAIVAKLNQEIVAVLANPEVRERISKAGAEPVGKSAAEFEAMLRAEYDATVKLVSRIGLKVD